MSQRERCMAGGFRRILSRLGIVVTNKGKSAPTSEAFLQELPSPPSSCTPPSASPATSQKMVNTVNVVCNQDVPAAHKGSAPAMASPTGFRVRVSVPVCHEPVVTECTPGSGGVQGLQWYSEKLMMDEDGDVAQEFLDEAASYASGPLTGCARTLPSFKMKMKTRPANKLGGPVCTCDGNASQPVLI